MNRIYKVLLATALTAGASSCNTFLDINTNPNQATSVTPNQLLGNALTVTAANYVNYNSFTNFNAGYWAKTNAVSGFTEERTYNYSSTYQQGLWSSTYDNLQDYNLIQQNGAKGGYPNHAAIARIMKAYNFLLLVDEYGDIPYTNALQGSTNVTPSFDKAADVYKDLIVQLKGAIADINANTTAAMPSTEDVVFGGGTTGMNKWKQFANSLRLRILLRESSTADGTLNAYVKSEMTTLQADAAKDGYITADVMVQPGYAASNLQQNPFYNVYGYAVGSSNVTASYRYILPTKYLVNLFVNNSDPRITQEFRPVGATATSPGTYVGSNLGESVIPSPTTGSTLQSALAGSPAGTFAGTFLRGPNQPQPIMLLSEHLFSKSEAEYRTLLSPSSGDAKTDYLSGIQASFQTTFRNSPPVSTLINNGDTDPTSNYNRYMAANAGNGLVDWDGTTTRQTDQYGTLTTGTRPVTVLEKIITQKWLAENTFAGTEAWADLRRTSLPPVPLSIQASAGKRPTRLLYPQTEVNTNKANVPLTTTQYDKIFWQP